MAQQDNQASLPTNSLKDYFKDHNINIKYSYNKRTQTHNYPGNWDFDGDGIADSLLLVGNGGAHLYFHPKVALSTGSVKEFTYIEIDFPAVGTANDLYRDEKGALPYIPQFVVADFDNDGINELYFHLDRNSFDAIEWGKRGVHTPYILLDCNDKKFTLSDFKY